MLTLEVFQVNCSFYRCCARAVARYMTHFRHARDTPCCL
jgi:hypothetical protein